MAPEESETRKLNGSRDGAVAPTIRNAPGDRRSPANEEYVMKRLLTASILALFCVSGVAAQLAIAPDGALFPDGGVEFVVPVSVPLLPAPRSYHMWGPVTPLYPVLWPNVLVGASSGTPISTHRTKDPDYGKPMPSRMESRIPENQSVRTDTRAIR